jgi:hypothetical protein
MTGEERTAAQATYGSSIDYDKVVIAGGSLAALGGATRTVGNTIYFEADAFTKLSGGDYSTLIHELGHVWQFQTGGAAYIPNALGAQATAYATTGESNNAYNWRDAASKQVPWEQWNAEQQADAMAAYADAMKSHDQATMDLLEPYRTKVLIGAGAPGGPADKPGDYNTGNPNAQPT